MLNHIRNLTKMFQKELVIFFLLTKINTKKNLIKLERKKKFQLAKNFNFVHYNILNLIKIVTTRFYHFIYECKTLIYIFY